MKCPNCDANLGVRAHIPEEQRLSITLTLEEGRMLTAETLGGVLTNFAKLMRATGENVSETNVETFIYAISHDANKIEVEFALIETKQPHSTGDGQK